LFSPIESEEKPLALLHERRQTDIAVGNRPDTNRKKRPKRRPFGHYTKGSYLKAIKRLCEKAFGMPIELRDPDYELDQLPEASRPAEKKRRLGAAAQWRELNCWAPNQLRHAVATQIVDTHDLETAQAVLGHSSPATTRRYVGRNLKRAARAMKDVG
jgi:hypothetical protein